MYYVIFCFVVSLVSVVRIVLFIFMVFIFFVLFCIILDSQSHPLPYLLPGQIFCRL
jgi:hypothetical protein